MSEPSPEQTAISCTSFVDELAELGPVKEVEDGLVVRADDVLHVHFDPVEWARYAVPLDTDRADWDESRAAQIASIADYRTLHGEHHLVMFRGRPETSTRATLPPIKGQAPQGGWVAYAPLVD